MISAISSNNNFTGRRDNVDALINMNDNQLRKIAYAQTQANFNEKKQRRITNALFYSAPIAAGVATAVLNNAPTTVFSKNLTGLAARAARGLKTSIKWVGALAAIDLLGMGKNKLSQILPEVRKFDAEHPWISMATMLSAGIGAIILVGKGASKLGALKGNKFLQKTTEKVANFINTNKVITKLKNGLRTLSQKTPSALKEIGATILSWTPTALMFGGLYHSINSNNAQIREFDKNYTNLRNQQQKLTRARMRELSAENDFFRLDKENLEDIQLVKNPLKNLPPEVREKVAAYRNLRDNT